MNQLFGQNESFIRRTSVSKRRAHEYKPNARYSQSHNIYKQRQKRPIRAFTITETVFSVKNIAKPPADEPSGAYSIRFAWNGFRYPLRSSQQHGFLRFGLRDRFSMLTDRNSFHENYPRRIALVTWQKNTAHCAYNEYSRSITRVQYIPQNMPCITQAGACNLRATTFFTWIGKPNPRYQLSITRESRANIWASQTTPSAFDRDVSDLRN